MWTEITRKSNTKLLDDYLQEEPDCERLLAVLSWDRIKQTNDSVSVSVFYRLASFNVDKNYIGFFLPK